MSIQRVFGNLAMVGALVFLTGCAFNVISIRQTPTVFAAEPPTQSVVLSADTDVSLVEGSARKLRSGTAWRKIGHINEGDVYATTDQVVTVVASNEHEAQLVVKDGQIAGFYLVVEHTFTPARKPVPFRAAPK